MKALVNENASTRHTTTLNMSQQVWSMRSMKHMQCGAHTGRAADKLSHSYEASYMQPPWSLPSTSSACQPLWVVLKGALECISVYNSAPECASVL
eukprot:70281-Chlamydomonas_euryale.AAC.3